MMDATYADKKCRHFYSTYHHIIKSHHSNGVYLTRTWRHNDFLLSEFCTLGMTLGDRSSYLDAQNEILGRPRKKPPTPWGMI